MSDDRIEYRGYTFVISKNTSDVPFNIRVLSPGNAKSVAGAAGQTRATAIETAKKVTDRIIKRAGAKLH
jgi:hypothetical protein